MSEPTPLFTGPHGKAWAIDMAAVAARYGNKPHSTMAVWVVHAPWANLAWHSYSIGLLHLRPVEGLPDPIIHLPFATHEVFVYALNPDWKLDLSEMPQYLVPANFVAQFIEADDAVALRRVEQCVIDIVHGQLSPDTDFLQHWIARFGASNIKGDPARAGETTIVIRHDDGNTEKIVHDPAPLDKKPRP